MPQNEGTNEGQSDVGDAVTHYDNLGLEATASDDEVTDAYRALVKVVHPDMGGDAVMFGILTESFDILSDQVQRAAYDRVALDHYNRGSAGTVDEIVTGCLSTYLVIRFVLYPALLIGGIMMAVPFLPVRIIGGVIVVLGLLSPMFVQHGARTTRKKARRAKP